MAELEAANPDMTEDAMAEAISARMEERGVRSHKVEVGTLLFFANVQNEEKYSVVFQTVDNLTVFQEP